MIKPTEPSAQDVTVRYAVQTASSRFTVQAFAAGLLSALGHNPVIAVSDFSGEVMLAEEIENSSVNLTVAAASLTVTNDVKEKDRIEIERIMHENVLQTEQYPEITYTCSRVSASKSGEGQYWAALNGNLTLHGVTRPLTISARVAVNGDTLRASGNFALLQSDYGIEIVSVAGGALKAKDEVRFAFEIVARKQG